MGGRASALVPEVLFLVLLLATSTHAHGREAPAAWLRGSVEYVQWGAPVSSAYPPPALQPVEAGDTRLFQDSEANTAARRAQRRPPVHASSDLLQPMPRPATPRAAPSLLSGEPSDYQVAEWGNFPAVVPTAHASVAAADQRRFSATWLRALLVCVALGSLAFIAASFVLAQWLIGRWDVGCGAQARRAAVTRGYRATPFPQPPSSPSPSEARTPSQAACSSYWPEAPQGGPELLPELGSAQPRR